ncbi:hypothetical protein [Acuticoccus kandeliae]|uniref:hypothetical protein n=1 Tax=Acuticoccus kandeliae TaxID=2073160 RepID=UPI000D3EBCEB|nr:hypothetical protein [Acuticoccus kandeliae]
MTTPRLADGVMTCPTATKFTPDMRGMVVVCGSHGGLYPGTLVVKAGLRGVVLCDAGVGLQEAGIASLPLLDTMGIPAATVSHTSCRIGDAQDMVERGIISFANEAARVLGVQPGDAAAAAAAAMRAAAEPALKTGAGEGEAEARIVEEGEGRTLVLIDSAAMVTPQDAGAIVVTGSHGGLVGGAPKMALQVDAFLALFNDAGIGIEEAGIGRLPALQTRGIAAATVSADTARIGEARSTLDDGILSAVNEAAAAMGGHIGMPARALVAAARRL